MNTVEIKTNNHWRPFKYGYEIPKKVLEEDFDWLVDNEDDGFIYYCNRWYHLSEFMDLHNKIYCINPPEFMNGWDGYISDSFFSGVLIKLSDDSEMYQIGTYLS